MPVARLADNEQGQKAKPLHPLLQPLSIITTIIIFRQGRGSHRLPTPHHARAHTKHIHTYLDLDTPMPHTRLLLRCFYFPIYLPILLAQGEQGNAVPWTTLYVALLLLRRQTCVSPRPTTFLLDSRSSSCPVYAIIIQI